MSSSAIGKFLGKITSGSAINIGAFHRTLRSNGLSRYIGVNDIFIEEKVGANYIVRVSDELRVELEKFKQVSVSTRAEAALSGESHSVKVNGSFLVAKYPGEIPFVLVFNEKGGVTPSLNASKSVLIIENRQCFLQAEALLDSFERDGFSVESNTLIICGVGNEVSNRLHKGLFSQFSHVFYFLDFDVGGLQIAQNVSAICHKESHHQFIIPRRARSLMRRMSKKGCLTQKERKSIASLGAGATFLHDACSLLLEMGHKVEQEAFLSE